MFHLEDDSSLRYRRFAAGVIAYCKGWDMRTMRCFSITIGRRAATRPSATAFLALSLLLLIGCSSSSGHPAAVIQYRLPFIPITFSLDSNGHFSVSTGLSITTPLGTFSAGAQVGIPISNDSTRVSIVHTVSGMSEEDVYDIAERGPMNVCLDGRFQESIGENNITIQALDGVSTVSIVQAGSQCDTATLSATPSSPANGQTGGSGSCTPKINAVGSFHATAAQTVEITGSCFGTGNVSSGTDTAYFHINDLTAGWNACWTGDPDTDQVTCNLSSWANGEITFSGFTGVYGQNGWLISPGDQIEVQVWNPQSSENPATYTVVAGS
jgi:hypothetical protein